MQLMQHSIRLKIFCRWLSLTSSSRTGNVNLPRTSFPLSMKENVAEKEVNIQEVTSLVPQNFETSYLDSWYFTIFSRVSEKMFFMYHIYW